MDARPKRLLLTAIFSASGVFSLECAAMPLFDFESPAERACAKTSATNGVFSPVKGFACSGEWSIEFSPNPWTKGAEQWPSITLTIPENRRDWSEYDHLSVDLLSFGKGCDILSCFIAPPDGPIQKGAKGKITLPPRKWKRWQIPLSELSAKWLIMKPFGLFVFL